MGERRLRQVGQRRLPVLLQPTHWGGNSRSMVASFSWFNRLPRVTAALYHIGLALTATTPLDKMRTICRIRNDRIDPGEAETVANMAQQAQKGIAYKWLALLVVAIGTYMSTLDSSIVNISFPVLSKLFNTDPSTVLWVSLIYMLTLTGLMLTFGRIGDSFGRKRVYTLGFIIFSLGLALCSVSQNIIQLILFRIVQAIGSSMTVASGTAIIAAAFPDRERGKALGIQGAVVGAGLMSGPALGGFLLDLFDWRSIFYLRLPVGVVGSVTAALVLKEQRVEGHRATFDYLGALALLGGLVTLLLGVNRGQALGWSSAPILALFGISAALLSFFLSLERRVDSPVVDLALFRNRLFTGSAVSLVLSFVASTAVTFLMPFYLMQGVGYSPAYAGLLLTTVPLTRLVFAPLSGWLSDRIGYRLLCSAGLSLISLALVLLGRLTVDSTAKDVVVGLATMGLGSGLFEAPNNSSIMGAAPKERLGTASAMISTARSVGMSTGLALAGAIFASRQLYHAAQLSSSSLTPEATQSRALVGGFHDALMVAALVCGIGILTSLIPAKREA